MSAPDFDPETGEILPSPPAFFDIDHSPTIAKLADALGKAQKEIRHAQRDGENPAFRAAYSTLTAAIDACRGPLADNGIATIQAPFNEGANIGVATMLVHSSGEWVKCRLAVKPGRPDAQGAGSVISYLRRYTLMAIAGVASEDDDGEAAKPVAKPVAPPKRAEPRPAPRAAASDDDPVRKEFKTIKAAILAAPHQLGLDSLKEVCAPGLALIRERSAEAYSQLMALFESRSKEFGATNGSTPNT